MTALAPVLVTAVISIGIAGCTQQVGTDERTDETATGRSTDPADSAANIEGTTGTGATVDVAQLMENPQAYVGKTVTVVADVEEVYGPRAFSLDEDAPLRGGIDKDMLVLGKASQLDEIDDQWLNNKVRVTGTVGTVALIEVEREIGWDLNPEIETELEGAGAVLIADSVTRVQEQ